MKLEELNVYNLAMEMGEEVWQIVDKWTNFQKDTIGKQLVRAADSVAANISEGFGRYHYREANHFNYYSRGSLYESKTWIQKGFNRKLIQEDEYNNFMEKIDHIGRMLNNYITSIGKASK
jgi:four helix bundle protein